jgi:hypothetical protein
MFQIFNSTYNLSANSHQQIKATQPAGEYFYIHENSRRAGNKRKLMIMLIENWNENCLKSFSVPFHFKALARSLTEKAV